MRADIFESDRYVHRVMVPLDRIHTNTGLFQNRHEDHSTDTVVRILVSLYNNTFDWYALDAIRLWRSNEDQQLYVTSGHSRFHAFSLLNNFLHHNQEPVDHGTIERILHQHDIPIGDFREKLQRFVTDSQRNFSHIPSIIDDQSSKEIAFQRAMISNALGTPENLVSRAAYIQYQWNNSTMSKKQFGKIYSAQEGTNWKYIRAFSFLSHGGNLYRLLKSIKESSNEFSIVKQIAYRIGSLRQRQTCISDSHENEIFQWLMNHDGYGKGKKQISHKRDFDVFINRLIREKKKNGGIQPHHMLNVRQLQNISYGLKQYYTLVQDIYRKIKVKKQELNKLTQQCLQNALKKNLSNHQDHLSSGALPQAMKDTKILDFEPLVHEQKTIMNDIMNMDLKVKHITMLEGVFDDDASDHLLQEALSVWNLEVLDKESLKIRKEKIIKANNAQTGLFD